MTGTDRSSMELMELMVHKDATGMTGIDRSSMELMELMVHKVSTGMTGMTGAQGADGD